MWENVGKKAKESFTVERLLFHTVNLSTENQAHLSLLRILCMNVAGKHTLMWSDASSPRVSGNSKWVEAKTSQDGISLWYLLLLF